jgi:F420-non-reducing hydrogenase iron-sulfur subunit
MVILKTIVENMGIDPERIWVRWISASEGKQFAAIITDMVEVLKTKGPNSLKKTWDI